MSGDVDTLVTAPDRELTASSTTADILRVFERPIPDGRMNTEDDVLHANIRASIRRGAKQLRRLPARYETVAIIGSGPSLDATLPELRALLHEGAKVVTVNGSYHWALEHNLHPSAQVVMDARPENARFLDPEIPRCQYLVASICAPETWDRVAGREDAWIWHPVAQKDPAAEILNAYYLRCWETIIGGTSVATRALFCLHLLGYRRFHFFGVDSCWIGDRHHAFDQPENEAERRYAVTVSPTGHPELARTFACAPWHVMQLQDMLRILRLHGDQFLLQIHGDGLLAYAVQVNADLADAEIRELA